jgi:hypothetical protein
VLNTCDGRRRDYPSCGVFYCCRALIIGSLNEWGPGTPQPPGRGKRVQSIALPLSDPEVRRLGDWRRYFRGERGGLLATCGQNGGQRCDRIPLMVADFHLTEHPHESLAGTQSPGVARCLLKCSGAARRDCSASTGPGQGPAFLLHCGEQFCTDAASARASTSAGRCFCSRGARSIAPASLVEANN